MNKHEHNNTSLSVIPNSEEMPDTLRTQKSIRKKAAVGAAAILGACTLISIGITQMVLAAEISKTEKIVTSYPVASSQPQQDDLAGYVKGDYTVKRSEKNQSVPLNVNAISMEEAAEIAAQYSWKLFGDNLDGKTVVAAYDPEENAWWIDSDCFVDSAGVETWYIFEINALNGAVYTAERSRTFPGDRNKLIHEVDDCDNNPDIFEEYKALARAAIEQNHLLSGNISSFRPSGSGTYNNDSSVRIEVCSDIGEKIALSYSCVDHALLEYISNDWHRASEIWASQQAPYDPVLGAIEGANLARLDSNVVHEVKEDEKGILYADHINEKGEVEWLRIGHTEKYVAE